MKRFGGFLLGVATLLAGSAPAAKVLYVDQKIQSEQPTGQSWHSAFSSVQDAIDAAAGEGGGETLKYTIKVPHGIVIAPSINQAPKINGHPSDAEPREFLLDVRKWNIETPVPITIDYSIHSDRSKSISTISQQYTLSLEKDPFGGIVFGRQAPSQE